MAVETRPELVGKRFLCLGGEEPPESGRWRAGVIRAVSQRDSHSPDLALLLFHYNSCLWVKDEEQVVGEDPVMLFTSAIGDDSEDMPEFITSLPPE
ncbi:hypothetical protein DUI87_11891 [Hirundo rustica rustica]|uniref:DUF7030 domain-containing protein n=1 Tax=Hirundo rustica rustica TaxID=333673 RepID=A0A3M0KXC2_HIRRU|nr:hypothetical protein DUI87_11891 [Hirundo rustica rustica]